MEFLVEIQNSEILLSTLKMLCLCLIKLIQTEVQRFICELCLINTYFSLTEGTLNLVQELFANCKQFSLLKFVQVN